MLFPCEAFEDVGWLDASKVMGSFLLSDSRTIDELEVDREL